jgi:hypothetical protein
VITTPINVMQFGMRGGGPEVWTSLLVKGDYNLVHLGVQGLHGG